MGVGDLAVKTMVPENGHSTPSSASIVNSFRVGRIAVPITFTMLSISVVALSDLNRVLFGDYLIRMTFLRPPTSFREKTIPRDA